jgi:hypothetical protein
MQGSHLSRKAEKLLLSAGPRSRFGDIATLTQLLVYTAALPIREIAGHWLGRLKGW